MASAHSFLVPAAGEGLRLDRLLSEQLPELSRRRARQLIESGLVKVDGLVRPKSYAAQAGQQVELEAYDEGRAQANAELGLEVLLETPELVVIDKPAGLPSAALPNSSRHTASAALLARYPEMSGVGFGPREPGLVHRLDTFTSGVLLAARSEPVFQALRQTLTSGELDKRYLAIVERQPPREQGVIDVPLGPDPRQRRRVQAAPRSGGRPCQTSYRVLFRGASSLLLELEASRAYRHQVRAHLAWLGCPLLGDVTYGGPSFGPTARHALHASSIAGTYTGPSGVRAFSVEAPLPADMADWLARDGFK